MFCPHSQVFRDQMAALDASLERILAYISASSGRVSLGGAPPSETLQQSANIIADCWQQEFHSFNDELERCRLSDNVPKKVHGAVVVNVSLLLEEFHHQLHTYQNTLGRDPRLAENDAQTGRKENGTVESESMANGEQQKQEVGKETRETPGKEQERATILQLYACAVCTQFVGLGLATLSRNMRRLRLCLATDASGHVDTQPDRSFDDGDDGDDDDDTLARGSRGSRQYTVGSMGHCGHCSHCDHCSTARGSHDSHSTVPVIIITPPPASPAIPVSRRDSRQGRGGDQKTHPLALWEHQMLCQAVPALSVALADTLTKNTPALAAALGRDLRADPGSMHAGAEAMVLRYRASGALPAPETTRDGQSDKDSLSGSSYSRCLLSWKKRFLTSSGHGQGSAPVAAQQSPSQPKEARDATETALLTDRVCRDFRFWNRSYQLGLVTDRRALRHFDDICVRAATALLAARPDRLVPLHTIDPRLPAGHFFGRHVILSDPHEKPSGSMSDVDSIREGNHSYARLKQVFSDCQTLLSEIRCDASPEKLHCIGGAKKLRLWAM